MSLATRNGELAAYVESLAGVKRKGTAGRPAWYVHDRLVARAEARDRWVIRCEFAYRESLLEDHRTFGVRPQIEGHQKVEAYVDVGDLDAIKAALRAAWEMQRRVR